MRTGCHWKRTEYRFPLGCQTKPNPIYLLSISFHFASLLQSLVVKSGSLSVTYFPASTKPGKMSLQNNCSFCSTILTLLGSFFTIRTMNDNDEKRDSWKNMEEKKKELTQHDHMDKVN